MTFAIILLKDKRNMKKITQIAAAFLVLLLMSFGVQDFYSSMTKVDYVEGTGTLKFTTKLNSAHISDALKINSNTAGFEAAVKQYINNNVAVSVDGEAKTLTFTGSQVNGETVWVYYETGGVGSMSSFKMKNTLLVNQFPKQLNLVNIAYKGQQKTLNFQKGSETQQVNF